MSAEKITPHPRYSRYGVSKSGNVYCLYVFWVHRIHKTLNIAPLNPPRKLTPKTAKGGYKTLTLLVDHKKLTRIVSRLVLETFSGHCPAGKHAAHLDGNPANNSLGNLRWKTAQENADDKFIHKTVLAGERNPNAKMTWAKVDRLRALAKGGTRTKELCRIFDLSKTVVQSIKAGKRWKEISRPYGTKFGARKAGAK